MKLTKYVFRESLIARLAILALFVTGGGNSAWAGDVITISFENNNVPTDWDNGGTYGGTQYNEFLTSNNGIYGKQTWYYSVLTSKNTIKIDDGQKIVLEASLYPEGSTYPYLEIWYSTDGSSWTKLKEWTSGFTYNTFDNYTYQISGDKLKEGCYLQIRDKKVKINSLKIEGAIPELTTIDEDVDPGEFKNGTTSFLTVKYTANVGWNTICMPIILRDYVNNHIANIFGTDWKAYTLSAYSENILTFTPIAASGYVQANTPLLVYAPNATGSQASLNLSDIAVTYSASPTATAGDATFQGTYAPMNMKGKFGVTSAGQVMEGSSTADIKGYRAYFTGISAPENGVRPTIVFTDDADAQGISAAMWMENAKVAYNLHGQKVEKGRKGIYIVNGKKVVIK